jgi:hypothetical protein
LHRLAVEAGVVDIETLRIGGPQQLARRVRATSGALSHQALQHVLMGDHLGARANKGVLLGGLFAGDNLAARFAKSVVAANMVATPIGVL